HSASAARMCHSSLRNATGKEHLSPAPKTGLPAAECGCHNTYVGPTAGLVTLLFTDIEAGVRLWEADGDAMAAASARYCRVVREQVEARGGRVFKTVGEAHRAAFADPVAALAAAVAIQQAVRVGPGPSGLAG